MSLTITKSSNPDAEAERIIQALRSGETVVCTGSGRSHHRRLPHSRSAGDNSVVGVDRVLHEIDALVKAALPAARNVPLHWPRGERLWAWSLNELTNISRTVGTVPGHAYFPKGTIGGAAEWVPDSQTRAVDGGEPDGGG